MTLAVIQPARIQDIEKSSYLLFGKKQIEGIGLDSLRRTHKLARKNELVIAVRRGSYCVSRRGSSIIRHGKISSQIDNRRLFLMKKERRNLN
jgi:hypothetical protein